MRPVTKDRTEANRLVDCFFGTIREIMIRQNVSYHDMLCKLECSNKHYESLIKKTKSLSMEKMVDIAGCLGYTLSIHLKKKTR